MNKGCLINLIRAHAECNEIAFRREALKIAGAFAQDGDEDLAEYIRVLIERADLLRPQENVSLNEYVIPVPLKVKPDLKLPVTLEHDLQGVINAIRHQSGLNTFCFAGEKGSGRSTAGQIVALETGRLLYKVECERLTGGYAEILRALQTLFYEIELLPHPQKTIIMFEDPDFSSLRQCAPATDGPSLYSVMLNGLDRLREQRGEMMLLFTGKDFLRDDRVLNKRLDLKVNFNVYNRKDLTEVAEHIFTVECSRYPGLKTDKRLFHKMLTLKDSLPNPGELKQIIRTAFATSGDGSSPDVMKRLFCGIENSKDELSVTMLRAKGFTVREIETLTGISRSTASRMLKGEKHE